MDAVWPVGEEREERIRGRRRTRVICIPAEKDRKTQ